MKTITLKSVLAVLVALFSLNANAYTFKTNNVMYDIISSTDFTCKVVGNGSVFGDAYSGDVVIPSTVTYGGKTYTVTTIGSKAFYWCKNLTSVTIPATVTTLESDAFSLSKSYTIYNYTTTPQSIQSSFFDIYFPTIHVYKGCKDVYASASGWSQCRIVDDIEPTKITSITLEQTNVNCYPYEGVRLTYSVSPLDASIKELNWTSSDETILHVENDGTLVGVSEGDAIVTAKAKDGSGVKVQCQVHVNAIRGGGSYKRHLASQTTGGSSITIGSYVQKSVSFNLQNIGKDFIFITELRVKNPNDNYSIISKSTDTSLLGWLASGQNKSLSVNLKTDVPTCYEWHYTYKGQEFVFCSDANDPAMKHDVTFYVDDNILVTYEYDQGDEIFIEEEPAKEGYTFSGWSEIPATMPNKNVTVKGTFTVNSYTLTYEVDGEVVKTSEVKYGKSITTKEQPQKEGYTFVASDEEPSTMPAKDVTIKGTFVVNKYNLTYKVDGDIVKTTEVEYGTALTAEAEPTKEGYTFSGWSEIPATMPAKDLTITGKFSINKYTLTYIVDGETHKTLDVKYGATIAAENAPEKEGYTFSGWSEIPATMPAKDVTVTGSFTVNKYRLTYIVDGATYSTTGVEYGATITSEVEPTKEGYTFSGWSEIPKTMPAKDVTITGSFTPNKYNLTYMVDGEIYKTYEVKYGATITPEDEPTKDGYTFSGWSEIPGTMPAKNVTVTGSFAMIFVFDLEKTYSFQSKQNEYYMTLSADGISIAEEPCALRFEEAGDGKYYITDGEYYVGLAGTDNWSMTSAPDKKEPLGLSSTTIDGQVYYSFSESLGMVGVDWPKKNNMGCWADKKTSDGDAVLWLVKEMEVVDAIADVKATEGDYQIYTIDGKAISTLQKGVNIIRYSNGKVKKVLIK